MKKTVRININTASVIKVNSNVIRNISEKNTAVFCMIDV